MKRFSEQLHKKSQTVKLTKSEQADLRERIVSYMEYHPLPAAMKATEAATAKKPARAKVLTDAFAYYAVPYQMLFKFGSVAAVFVLLFIPFMAERSMPGDTLYAVKVQFNEEVRSSLTWGSYEKVEWETARLNRRIAEARLLADEGLLTDEVEAEVAAAVKAHSDNAKREIEVLRESDADEAAIASIAFDSSLSVQAQAFGDEAAAPANATGTARAGMLISNAVGESLEKNPNIEADAVPAYSKLMARVEQNTTRVRDLRDALAGSVSEQDLADVSRRIEDIERAILVAIDLAAEEPTELDARIALVDVIARTQKLIVFMTELDVREQVTIEEVVPVVLTDEEMRTERSNRTAQVNAAMTRIAAAIETLEDPAVVEKLLAVQEQLTAALEQQGAIDDYKEYIAASDNTLDLAADALTLIEQSGTIDSGEIELVPDDTSSTSSATTTDEVDIDTDDLEITSTSSATTTPDTAVDDSEEVGGVSPAATSSDATATTSEITQPAVDEQS